MNGTIYRIIYNLTEDQCVVDCEHLLRVNKYLADQDFYFWTAVVMLGIASFLVGINVQKYILNKKWRDSK